ncbi:MAG: nuclear transport factor 2 family protein [Pseudomonadota bacterium]
MPNLSFILVLAIALVACAETPIQQSAESAADPLVDFKTAIRSKYDMKEAAFAANNVEPILTRFYSEQAISTGPDGTTKIGRAELRPVYEEVIGGNVRIESFETVLNGDAGWDWVNFHVTPSAESGEKPFTFKMLFVWENIDGEWWSHGEMYVFGKFDME